jgi:hypothetical protein
MEEPACESHDAIQAATKKPRKFCLRGLDLISSVVFAVLIRGGG